MVRKIATVCALTALVLIAIVFVIESIRDNPKVILGGVFLEARDIGTEQPLPREGEKLTYSIKYLWIIPVATAEIKVGKKEGYKNRNVYPLMAKGRVSGFMSSFVKAQGVIKSYVDVNKLYPWRYEEKAHAEGHRPSEKVILYDQDSQIMEFEDIRRKVPKNTQDPLSALFYLRWQEYEKDKAISFNVNSNKENYTLASKFLGKDTVRLEGREKKLLVIESNISSPKEYSKSEAKITTYVTDDGARIPVLLKIRTKFGPLAVRLTGIE